MENQTGFRVKVQRFGGYLTSLRKKSPTSKRSESGG
ncbi:hypothetical protein SAMN05216169_101456 [Anoxybacillus pushchinoensis]|uniref:Uncharacterized protein n=1 Tax=Anoxybacillus pushchinoensis TaxID=150248 RepID=A0A1I0T5H2_9BACL|nr:hypothetical protein SAMN05216169_101456 [Anoxybacillus pushchinoensis]